MSMYADYIKEHRNDEIIENEFGFLTYRYLNDTQVYIIDIYVLPEMRQSHAATALADQVCKIAKEEGYKELLGSVVPTAYNSTTSLKVLLGYGMTLKSANVDLIIFSKML